MGPYSHIVHIVAVGAVCLGAAIIGGAVIAAKVTKSPDGRKAVQALAGLAIFYLMMRAFGLTR